MSKTPRQIAIYGKGGIGKSTTSSNLSAAFSLMNLKIAQIGCDPKADSVNTLLEGNFITTILDNIKDYGQSEQTILDSINFGFNNILCVESGGPPPGQGCAGRGVLVALNLLEQFNILKKFDIDIAIYDVLGDIVCGGFAQPIRQGYAQEVYIVTSGEYMSLYAANNIAASLNQFANQGLKSRAAGIIANLRNVEDELEIIQEFSNKIGVPLISVINRSELVQSAESSGKTVIEAFPSSSQAEVYKKLAHNVMQNQTRVVPDFVSRQDLVSILRR